MELQSDRTIKKRQGIPLLCEFVECRSDINIKKRQGFSLLCDSVELRSGRTIKKRQGFSLFVCTLKSSMPSACQPARFSRSSLLLQNPHENPNCALQDPSLRPKMSLLPRFYKGLRTPWNRPFGGPPRPLGRLDWATAHFCYKTPTRIKIMLSKTPF